MLVIPRDVIFSISDLGVILYCGEKLDASQSKE